MNRQEIARQRNAVAARNRRPVIRDDIITVTALLIALKITHAMTAGFSWFDVLLVVVGWVIGSIVLCFVSHVWHGWKEAKERRKWR